MPSLLVSTFQHLLWSSCSSSCSYRKNGLVVDINLEQYEGLIPREWAHNHGGSLQRDIATDGRLFWFCYLWRLTMTFSLSASLFRLLPDCFKPCFKPWLQDWHLPTYDLSEGQVSLTSQTLSISMAVPIAYRMWVLEAICTAEQKGSGLWD